jgi:hypothetical protein
VSALGVFDRILVEISGEPVTAEINGVVHGILTREEIVITVIPYLTKLEPQLAEFLKL